MRGLVEYSSSDDGDNNDHGAAAPTTSGRVRSFPHVDGQFAVHVHAPAVPPEDVVVALQRCVAQVREDWWEGVGERSPSSSIHPVHPIHIPSINLTHNTKHSSHRPCPASLPSTA